MTSIKYLIPRIARHFLPESLAIWLLKHGWIIKPGLETISPQQAAERYSSHLGEHHLTLKGMRVMVFGYGGNLSIAAWLLSAGARHVVLVERAGLPKKYDLDEIAKQFPQFFSKYSDGFKIDPQYISIFHYDINALAKENTFSPVDLVLTSSVYEHLEQPEVITHALAQLIDNGGSHLHFIDLRDHYFTYPFEMLCHSQSVWRTWLNPTSNLNRYRITDYLTLFKKYFLDVHLITEAADLPNFTKCKGRIRSEFLSGNDEMDCITQICLVASKPRFPQEGDV